MKFFDVVEKIWFLLGSKDRRRVLLLLLMVTASACLDVVGVASVMPFMAVLASPSLIQSNATLHHLFVFLAFDDQKDFFIFLGMMVFISIALAQIFKALTHYVQLQFCLLQEYRMGKKLFASFLNRPYSWLIQRDTATLGKALLSEIHQVIQGILLPLLMACSRAIAALFLVGLLSVAASQVALVVSAVMGVSYWLMYRYAKPRLDRIGHLRFTANEERYLVVSDALAAAKEIKVGGFEAVFISRFSAPAFTYAVNQANAQAFLQVPRSVVELIAIGGMLLLVLHSLSNEGALMAAVPLIALYFFAAYRLMPALQQIYVNVSEVRSNLPALQVIYEHFSRIEPVEKRIPTIQPLPLQQEICFNDVYFYYPTSTTPSLNGLTLRIKAGSTFGIVGSSGCGKTTLATILSGLLPPERGEVTVDGQPLTASNWPRWKSTIGYVPQQIYLSNDTVAANIAFGIDADQRDQGAIERAAMAAQLHEFICHALPHGYHTLVGERGVRLSGGQRQRIAIARALYKAPKVLILDEATSALDNVTERLVMNALEILSGQVTVILIAHRLSTVKRCTQVALLDGGKTIAVGTYDQLLETSATFRNMVNGEPSTHLSEPSALEQG